MKRFISLAMAAAMTVTLLPATAFAATGDVKATAKVVGSDNYTEDEMETENGKIEKADAAELQLTFTTADYATSSVPEAEIELTLDNADFLDESGNVIEDGTTTLENLDDLIYLQDDDYLYKLTKDSDNYYFKNSNVNGGAALEDSTGTKIEISDLEISDTDNLTFTLTGKMNVDGYCPTIWLPS